MNVNKFAPRISILAVIVCGLGSLMNLFIFKNYTWAFIDAVLSLGNLYMFRLNGGFNRGSKPSTIEVSE